MFSTIFPMLMTITIFVLVILCICAGQSPSFLQDYSILNINTTLLKATSNSSLPIPNVYSLFLENHCSGNYSASYLPPITNIRCSARSTNSKFNLANIIAADIHSVGSNTSVVVPADIPRAFNEKFDTELRVALIFYILSAIFLAFTIIWGIFCVFYGPLAVFAWLFLSPSSTFLLIASALATTVTTQAQSLINDVGADVGLQAYGGNKFLALTWSAFVLNFCCGIVWVVAGSVSTAIRS